MGRLPLQPAWGRGGIKEKHDMSNICLHFNLCAGSTFESAKTEAHR